MNAHNVGGDKTSVRVHQTPGGNSSLCLGWEQKCEAVKNRSTYRHLMFRSRSQPINYCVRGWPSYRTVGREEEHLPDICVAGQEGDTADWRQHNYQPWRAVLARQDQRQG